ncbi:unnamed protein product [Prorocentrum cordatum]|uniref:Uncharacterized protein n=1 Tax=Prorocentrum cordatum TaxID=2364126 RepID=A0ABN9SUI8_9DINO|nr:unnamed protein product [Polarella glacialis]
MAALYTKHRKRGSSFGLFVALPPSAPLQPAWLVAGMAAGQAGPEELEVECAAGAAAELGAGDLSRVSRPAAAAGAVSQAGGHCT